MNQDKFKEGVKLFNQGHFFEAHEVWEEIWLKDKNSEAGKMLKGLIQYAAALLKQRQGQTKPALSLGRSALAKLQSVDQKLSQSWGLDLASWLKQLEVFIQKEAPACRTGRDTS